MKGTLDDRTWIWISHPLSAETPVYRGGAQPQIAAETRIADGQSSNTLRFSMTNHMGSHVDAPLHFLEGGATVDSYAPGDWIFARPLLIDVPCTRAIVLEPKSVLHLLPDGRDADLLLMRTGMGALRDKASYWQSYPGWSSELAEALIRRCPTLRAIGLDTISLSSISHREEGHRAHRAFLSRGIRIIEDLALGAIEPGASIDQVVAFPLRLLGGDAAPCTVAARVDVGGRQR